jgi:phage gp36-like protein
MSYCIQNGDTPGDIAPSLITMAKLTRLTCDEAVDKTAIVQDAIDGAIAAGDGDIDSYGGRVYVVPFNPVPDKVKQLSRRLAVFYLHQKRIDVLGGEIPKSIQDMYDSGIAFLKDVAKGVAVIDGAVKPTVNTARTGGSFNANPRVFGKSSLDQL